MWITGTYWKIQRVNLAGRSSIDMIIIILIVVLLVKKNTENKN